MRRSALSIVFGFAGLTLLITTALASAQMAPPAAPMDAHSAGRPHPVAGGASTTGKVLQTMNAGTYTYVEVDDGAKKIWAAAPQFAVTVGDQVVVPSGLPMKNFESKTLGRTFDVVYFVDRVQIVGQPSANPTVATAHAGTRKTDAVAIDVSGIEKADGGQTIAELFAGRDSLRGKEVTVRGRVAKFTANVMGKNWIHVQDGTGGDGANDITVTTDATAAVGDTVLVRGKLGTDKDLGFGYQYAVIIENASVVVE